MCADRRESSSWNKSVTPEVAGSSPVAPVSGVEHAAAVAVAPSENRESIDKVDEMQDGQGTEMMRKHHQMTLWAPFAVIALGGFVALA
ncbi:MAG: hypothetical protein ACR2M2_11250, partial [Gaiellaceae bacterium]